ncbi:hypothetical protein AA313_de0205730 [Arthrobotrys entomopaga]|nr:hypothetical protein AA313_de0205730 [Arthrobotrys entomopaga]
MQRFTVLTPPASTSSSGKYLKPDNVVSEKPVPIALPKGAKKVSNLIGLWAERECPKVPTGERGLPKSPSTKRVPQFLVQNTIKKLSTPKPASSPQVPRSLVQQRIAAFTSLSEAQKDRAKAACSEFVSAASSNRGSVLISPPPTRRTEGFVNPATTTSTTTSTGRTEGIVHPTNIRRTEGFVNPTTTMGRTEGPVHPAHSEAAPEIVEPAPIREPPSFVSIFDLFLNDDDDKDDKSASPADSADIGTYPESQRLYDEIESMDIMRGSSAYSHEAYEGRFSGCHGETVPSSWIGTATLLGTRRFSGQVIDEKRAKAAIKVPQRLISDTNWIRQAPAAAVPTEMGRPLRRPSSSLPIASYFVNSPWGALPVDGPTDFIQYRVKRVSPNPNPVITVHKRRQPVPTGRQRKRRTPPQILRDLLVSFFPFN